MRLEVKDGAFPFSNANGRPLYLFGRRPELTLSVAPIFAPLICLRRCRRKRPIIHLLILCISYWEEQMSSWVLFCGCHYYWIVDTRRGNVCSIGPINSFLASVSGQHVSLYRTSYCCSNNTHDAKWRHHQEGFTFFGASSIPPTAIITNARNC